jgi:Calx-beta domain
MKRLVLRLAGAATVLAAVVLAAPQPAAAASVPVEIDPCLVIPCMNIDDVHCFEDDWCQVGVYLSVPVREPVTVRFRTVDGTATAPEDYEPILDGVLTIEPGATTAAVVLSVVPDRLPEPDEDFTVVLFEASAGVITDEQATVVIADTRPAR